jgi:hypothetical protein
MMIIAPMDVQTLELCAALLLTALSVRSFWHIARRRSWVSVANARSLVFAGGLLASMIYFWFKFLKPFVS